MAGLFRTLGIFGGFVAVVAAAFYPIYFRPLLLPEEYSESLRGERLGAGIWLCPRARVCGPAGLRGAGAQAGVPGLRVCWGLPLEKEQSINRAGIVQEDIQPAGLKVWSDPFGRK
ncbi:hypothetical protein QYF61_027057 [Mycteria americana]|uniref:Small integral membrane protein 20 n=1 Tax=Mycteria americana TaxID=33587 RepID=A0AAN7RW30_MYCAM|nr:hypothetical protein QYF61_027057 [Mycteria americana]